ncbi:hypothetical protein ACQPYA_05165 [Micromonospora sp. CA-263727]|uniref:hypothetical protein n=1 Tax=Micromonospora sp. CA-263727 TaxID=3239967 RepID=UPI003D90578F
MVRPDVAKRGLLFLGFALTLNLPIALLVGVRLLPGDATLLGILGALGCLLALTCVPLGLQLWLIGSGGPVLAFGPAGLWIRTRPTRGQAVWLPWAAVAQISRRRWGLERMLVVTLHDPRVLRNLGAYTALDSGMLTTIYGSGLVATLTFADRPEAEIVAAVAYHSAGRFRIL